VFSSNPPLEPSEVLLMVMAGQTPADPSGNGAGGVRLTQFGAYLGRGIFRSLGGVNDTQRLEISSGERISQQGRETYEISYRLGERWSLIGEYDEFDSYNAAVKWHVYKQEGTDETE
jgi:translocation and assembly module TamB